MENTYQGDDIDDEDENGIDDSEDGFDDMEEIPLDTTHAAPIAKKTSKHAAKPPAKAVSLILI